MSSIKRDVKKKLLRRPERRGFLEVQPYDDLSRVILSLNSVSARSPTILNPGSFRKQVLMMRAVIVLILSITAASATGWAEDRSQEINQLFATFDKPSSPGCSV